MEVQPDTPSVFTTQSDALVRFLQQPDAAQRCQLYPHQIDAALRLRQHFQNQNAPDIALVVLPTGAGKTGVAVLAPYVCNCPRVLVITPSAKVSQQIANEFGVYRNQSFLYRRGVVPPATATHLILPSIHVVVGRDLEERIRERTLRNNLVVTNVHKIGTQARENALVRITDIPRNFDMVIVDEAHHYPAPTWHQFVNYFREGENPARCVFLTGTPLHNNQPIFGRYQNQYLAYELSRTEAIRRGIIRTLQYDSVPLHLRNRENEEPAAFLEMATRIRNHLIDHDRRNPNVVHQAMVLCQTVQDLNSATLFVNQYNSQRGIAQNDVAALYTSGSPIEILYGFQGFNDELQQRVDRTSRVLVVVGRLLEGFDHTPVSVVAIARNVRARVLFEQFVGRAVRRTGAGDINTAVLVTHDRFNQQSNYDRLDQLAEETDDEPDEDN